MTLSKSNYMLYLKHPAWMWLKVHQKHKLPPTSETLQAVFDAGNEFETYAEKLYPNGQKLGFDGYKQYLSLPQRTKTALDNGAQTIFQGRFEADNITCIIDILDRVKGNTYDLIEIKSSGRVKREHEYDLAFQLLVLKKSGLKIRNISVIHANSKYRRKGAIVPQKITNQTDITEKVKSLLDLTQEQVTKALAILSEKEMPDMSLRHTNKLGIAGVRWFGSWLDIFKTLKTNTDPYNIYNLSYPTSQQIGELEDKKITKIKDIPEKMALRPKQEMQIISTRENKQIIDKEKIKEFVDSLKYPLYFYDYETMSSVIPDFDRFGPNQDYPFQYSVHIQQKPGEKPTHHEYIHKETSNPVPDLLKKLKKDIGPIGTILSWSMSYEKSCNNRMSELYPEYKEFLDDVNKRTNDLIIPFSRMWFVDKDFFGSASLKAVMPIMVPSLSYKVLDISDGLLARRVWTKLVVEGEDQENKEKLFDDLSKYCTLDTFAMVKILEKLEQVVKE